MTHRQRHLLSYQKAKLLESGSTSESEDFHLEPAVVMKQKSAPAYLKNFHQSELKQALGSYKTEKELSRADCALIWGIASRKKFRAFGSQKEASQNVEDNEQ